MIVATIQVGILGLGRLGTSLALALKRASKANPKQPFVITGYDPSPAQGIDAQRRGALDARTDHPEQAAAGRQIVVLALPYAGVREAYRIIGRALQPGTVLLDFSPLTQPSQRWAREYLGAEAYLISMVAVLNPAYLFDGLDDAAHAAEDLFDKGAMLIMPTPQAPREAVELASDFADLVGAVPRFSDPNELDAWSAAVEGLPALLGAAAFFALQTNDGWQDAQRAGNPNFGRLTHHLADSHPDDLRDLLLHNREAMVRQVDAVVDVLGALREALAANDRAALEEALITSRDAYAEWLNKRRRADWGDGPERPGSRKEGAADVWMSGLLGGYLTRRLRGRKDDQAG